MFESHLVNRADTALTSDDWAAMAEQFAENAKYFDSTYGLHEGRESIRIFLRKSIEGLDAWRFPIQWIEIGEGRVIVHLLNRAPGKRDDGSFYEFPSVTIVEYANNGNIVSQMDLYDRLAAVQTFSASKLGGLHGRLRCALGFG
jgi:hypothetical protein